jgi:hypothetical protein
MDKVQTAGFLLQNFGGPLAPIGMGLSLFGDFKTMKEQQRQIDQQAFNNYNQSVKSDALGSL